MITISVHLQIGMSQCLFNRDSARGVECQTFLHEVNGEWICFGEELRERRSFTERKGPMAIA